MLNLLFGSIIVSAIPQELNWADFEGKNLLTMARSQTTPNYCEAGWAFSATSALNDRIKIKRDGAWQDVILSPQVLLSCDWYSRGCKGGSPYSAYRYIYRNEITDETCSVYEARGRTNGLGCSELEICKTCEPGAGCETPESYWVYPITDYGSVKGEKQIISELQNGPIACEVKVSEDFRNFKGGRIIQDKEFDGDLQHSVSITGYGTENGVDYWHVRNSWGIWWGDQGGFFKIARGSNLMQIEDNCAWATPGDAYLKTTKKISPQKSNPERIYYNDLLAQDTTPVKITKALPHEKYTLDSFPTQIDWRNHNGQNYASWTRNHHSPTYCGGCWVHATSSSIADRVNIFRNNTFPTISVSSQATINCFAGGSCHGGLPIGMYFYAHHHGAVDDTCQQYVAVEPESFACTAINECKICDPPVPGNNDSSQCRAVENIPRYYIDNYGHARGVHEMKGQIYEYGPISCFMATTPEFYAYTGGIFSQKQSFHLFDHVVSIVGWGVSEEGVEYWIGRNSWGTFWGDQGWFKIQMHKDNLGIEDWCSWGIPTADKPEDQGQFSKVL